MINLTGWEAYKFNTLFTSSSVAAKMDKISNSASQTLGDHKCCTTFYGFFFFSLSVTHSRVAFPKRPRTMLKVLRGLLGKANSRAENRTIIAVVASYILTAACKL